MKLSRREALLTHTLVAVASIIIVFPIAWMILSSFKADTEFFSDSLIFWPTKWSIEGYRTVFDSNIPVPRWLANGLFIAGTQAIGQVIVGVMAAYAFARYQFRGRTLLFYFVLSTVIIPPQTLMVPRFVLINEFDWVDTYQGVIMPNLASGFAIFMLRQFFLGVPSELPEAAMLDGCGEIGILRHVYLPQVWPSIAALSILVFVSAWNDYSWPLVVMMSNRERLPLTVALNYFVNDFDQDFVATMAIATLTILPVLFLYMLAQRQFVSGFAGSGLKG